MATIADGVIESPEETFDNGNTLRCDGCSDACQIDACH